MAKTERRVEDIVGDGGEMAEALEAVVAVAEDQGTVAWGDVSEDLSSGQWGRLIESGLLVDADGDGFVLDDPEGVREALADSEADVGPVSSSSGDKDLSWSRYDKLAGLGVLVLFISYTQTGLRSTFAGAVDVFLGPLNAILPFHVMVMILAIVTGLWTAILQDNLMDTDVIADYQETQQKYKEKIDQAKEQGDDDRVKELRQEQMEEMDIGVFKAQFKPMVWIMLFTIPAFLWIYWMILDVGVTTAGPAMVIPLYGEVPQWTTAVLGPIQLWLVWYFVCSLSFSQIMRKALNVQTSPTG
jgi:uncharacterized membrane protein (DUF106 family)